MWMKFSQGFELHRGNGDRVWWKPENGTTEVGVGTGHRIRHTSGP